MLEKNLNAGSKILEIHSQEDLSGKISVIENNIFDETLIKKKRKSTQFIINKYYLKNLFLI